MAFFGVLWRSLAFFGVLWRPGGFLDRGVFQRCSAVEMGSSVIHALRRLENIAVILSEAIHALRRLENIAVILSEAIHALRRLENIAVILSEAKDPTRDAGGHTRGPLRWNIAEMVVGSFASLRMTARGDSGVLRFAQDDSNA